MLMLKGFLFCALLLNVAASFSDDPYDVLGISRSATAAEVRKAYRREAKKWHPDKNKSPEAPQKFLDIQSAHQILSDVELRSSYDQFGTTDRPQSNNYGFHSQHQGFPNQLNIHQLRNIVFPHSNEKPFVILVCGHPAIWTTHTESIKAFWKKISTSLENEGFEHGWVDSIFQPHMLRELNVDAIPALVLVYRGNKAVLYGDLEKDWRQFISSHIMKWHGSVVRILSSLEERESFIEDSKMDKPRVIFGSDNLRIPAWFLLLASQNTDFQDFGFMHLTDRVGSYQSVLIYKDGDTRVYGQVKVKGRPLTHIKQDLTDFRFNTLPRIHSLSRFDQLCPIHEYYRICAILILDFELENTSSLKELLVRKLKDYRHLKEKFSFMYVDAHSQKSFVNSLLDGDSGDASQHNLFLIRRNSINHDADVSSYAVEDSREFINRVTAAHANISLRGFERTITLASLVDEFGPSLAWRLVLGIWSAVADPSDQLTTIFTLFSPIIVLAILCYGADATKTNRRRKEARTKSNASKETPLPSKSTHFNFNPASLAERSADETSSGARLDIVLLTDDIFRGDHTKNFFQVMKSYLRDQKIFADVVNWSEHKEWCEHILDEADTEEELLADVGEHSDDINGSVFVINAPKLWCCVFRPPKLTYAAGGDDSSSQSYQRALAAFLDRVMEGQKRRIHFESWNFS